VILPIDRERCFTIAGFTFKVRSGDLPVVLEAVPFYSPFLTERKEGHSSVSVRIFVGGAPPVEELGNVFNSGEVWSLHRDDGILYVVIKDGRKDLPPHWVARIDVAGKKADLFCGEERIVNRGGERVILNPFTYPLDQILLMIFLDGEGFTTHAAGALVEGRGLIFPGVSGAGKSTVTRLLAGDDRFLLLSDDRVVLRRKNDNVRVFGTPWPGDAGVAKNAEGPLAAILFLARGGEGAISTLTREEALRRLLPVISVPWYDRKLTEASLSFCEKLLDAVPAYELSFRLDSPVAAMVGEFASTL
jgi:hypothetical protein